VTWELGPARSTEAGRVGAVLSAAVDATPWLPRVHSRAQEIGFAAEMIDAGWVTVLRHSDDVTGFLARAGCEIHGLYLTAAVHGKGFGKALLTDAKQHCDNLKLWSFQANTGANRFYCREGFIETTRTDGAGNDAHLPDIRFEWHRKDAQ